MSKELSYLSADGFTVFTSQFHKNRGTCCKSACIHCPYGFTLKKHGLKFLDASSVEEIERITKEAGVEINWREFYPENLKLISLKDSICGYILKNHIIVKHLVLTPEFRDQGLSKEMVESYYFI